jgi:tetratricopeptide (TPR) repeat protein
MKSSNKEEEKQYQIVCPNCKSELILDPEEIEKREFTCTECGKKSTFFENELTEVGKEEEESEDISESLPAKNLKFKKLYIIIGIIIIAAAAFYFYADSSDSITFINKKGKAEKHIKAGSDLLSSQLNNQNPDMQTVQNALAEFTTALNFQPDNTDALMSKASILANTGKFAEAITDLDKLIGLNQSIPDAYFYRALCKLQSGDLANSIADFDKTIELSPDNLSAIFYKSNTKYLLKDFEGAKKDLSQLIDANPKIPNGYALRGLCDVELGNKKAGCEDFYKAKELGFQEADSLIKKNCK